MLERTPVRHAERTHDVFARHSGRTPRAIILCHRSQRAFRAIARSRHSERTFWIIARGIHRSLAMLPLLALALATPACEDLPAAPNVPPTASFVYSPVSPIIAGGTVVRFNASGSRDSDGSIASYSFDFGDGTPPVSGASPTATHVFPDTSYTCFEVVYTTLLTVTDDQGDTGTASQPVTVIELPDPRSAECQ